MGQHKQLVSNFHDAPMLITALLKGLRPPELQKHRGFVNVKKAAKCKSHKHATMCNITRKKEKRSETTHWIEPKHCSQLWASLYVPWTIPGASQVFQAAGSERQASALQIHHLSLPLLPSGKSVSTTTEQEEEEEVEKEGGRERR